MVCPVCQFDGDPLAQVGPVAVCASCGSSIALEGDPRKATAVDTTDLSDADLRVLRTARASIVRPQ